MEEQEVFDYGDKPYALKWPQKPLGDPLTFDEKSALLSELEREVANAGKDNVVNIDLTLRQIEFIQQNVENAYVIKMTEVVKEGGVFWCIIGPDEETARTYKRQI